jgi:hypothetical protein
MNRFPIGPVALLAVVILLTAPVVLGVQLLQKEQALVDASHEPCLFDDVACQLRDVARFAGVAPELLGRLLPRHQSPTKRGQT